MRRPAGRGEDTAMDVESRTHRALAEPSRARLLSLLERETRPLAVEELAERSGLHANTVRAHLEVLAAAGLVASALEPRTRPGRPRRLFSALPRPDARAREHELLAAALAGSLDPLPDGPRLAEASGRSWGRHLAGRPPAAPASGPEEALSELVGLLAERGFSPVAEGAAITMCSCPFRELAMRYERVVCALHRGLIRGALEGMGAPLEIEELRPWVAPDRCVATLRARAGAAPAGA
jgi:predicted ArsR family transcriptional regulator